jgi:hypothetical protein
MSKKILILKKMKTYKVYFAILKPGGGQGSEQSQNLRLESPNDFIEAAKALKTYGYPNPNSIRILRIE